MVERAEAEQRVVLTRDRTFVTANYCDQVGGPLLCTLGQPQAHLLDLGPPGVPGAELTRARLALQTNKKTTSSRVQAYLVQRDTKRAQLEEVIGAFRLEVIQEEVLTR